MISVIVTCSEPGRLSKIYGWLGTYAMDRRWSVNVLTMDKVKIDFYGDGQEQEIVAFKLKFCGL